MVPQVTSSMDICPGMWCTHSQDVSLLFHLFHLLSLYIYIYICYDTTKNGTEHFSGCKNYMFPVKTCYCITPHDGYGNKTG